MTIVGDQFFSQRQFGILGWKSDGEYLIRHGIGWLQFTSLTKNQTAQVLTLKEGEEKVFMFKTAAGPKMYPIKRFIDSVCKEKTDV